MIEKKSNPFTPPAQEGDSLGWGCALIILLIPIHIWDAFVISILWRWFAVPLGLPIIPFPQVAGLSLIIMMVQTRKKSTASSQDTIYYNIVIPAMALGMGALFHWLMTR